MIVMQKLKFVQDFTSVINVICVYIAVCKQNYQRITAHVQNMHKHVFVAYKRVRMMHIYTIAITIDL